MGIVNEIRSYGEYLKDQKIVEKILRILSAKFDGVVVSIEESKDLTHLSVNELMGSLQSHEQRINRSSTKSIEQAFQARGNIFKDKSGSSHEESEDTFGRGRGRGQTYRGGRGRGRFFSASNKGRGNDESDGGKRFNKSEVQCFYCKKFSHYKRNCWKNQTQKAKFFEEKEVVGTLFLASNSTNNVSKEVWLMESGCNNHMIGNKDGFIEIDEPTKSDVLLGDDKRFEAKGKGTIAVKTNEGKPKHINDILYVPHLAHNLLSVGQLLEKRYLIFFKDKQCIIYDKNDHSKLIAKANMLQNIIFAFNLPCEIEAKPRCFEDAVKDFVWCKAMDEEMAAIKKNATWELVDPPTQK
eukprot:PITA_28745